MAGDRLFRKPSISVVQGDDQPFYAKIETATYMYPGVRVMYDSYEGSIKCGGTDPSDNVGILGYESTPLPYRPADRDTIYSAGDHVAVHAKPGMRFRGWLKAGTSAVTPGKLLVGSDASGCFQIYTDGEDQNYKRAYALESVTPNSSANTACWMQYLG